MNIIIREKRSGTEVWLSLEKVADLMKLAPEDIEWAIEPSRGGSCDIEERLEDLAAERNHLGVKAKSLVGSSHRARARGRRPHWTYDAVGGVQSGCVAM